MNGHVRAIVTSVVLLACAFVVVFTATASRGASSNATVRATNGLLAYQASVGKHPHRHPQIFTVQPDGTHVHQLTHFGDSRPVWPDWSPDGRKIIFTRIWGDYPAPLVAAPFQLVTMNADGSAMRAVTSRGLDTHASYLPDGILYYRGSSHVWVVANPDGTHIRSTARKVKSPNYCIASRRSAPCTRGREGRSRDWAALVRRSRPPARAP
jgi:WD40-like Beta Propeller Repeat